MPHKHKRDKAKDDAYDYDLPPSKTAQSLPVKRAATSSNTTRPPNKSSKRKHTRLDDDTPRAFTRLLSGYRPPRSGLDEGTRPSKRHKTLQSSAETGNTAPPSSLIVPSIHPNEPLSSFNARVDAALPFSGLSKKSGGGKEGEKERKTKTERKMQKMQKEWREEERRRKEKLQENAYDAGIDEGGINDLLHVTKKGKRKCAKKKGLVGDNTVSMDDDDDDDPWAHIKAKRLLDHGEKATDGSKGGLIGLHDVVLAPPRFSRASKGKENYNVAKGTGGLKRQGELTEARKSIIEGYRQMMRDKRGEDV